MVIGPITFHATMSDGSPTNVRIFDDSRFVHAYHVSNYSHHAKFEVLQWLWWKFTTSDHKVPGLERVMILSFRISHNRHTNHQEVEGVGSGNAIEFEKYYDQTLRPDVECWSGYSIQRMA
jgi:hypothetical protein